MVCWQHTVNLPLPVLELATGKLHKPNVGAAEAALIPKTKPRRFTAKVLAACSKELADFQDALVIDLKAEPEFLRAMEEPRLALFAAQSKLEKALRAKGGAGTLKALGRLHPYDLCRVFGT